MSYQRMTFKGRMDIFSMYHLEKLKIKEIASRQKRARSSISREIARGMGSGHYNPFLAEYEPVKQRRYQSPKLKIDVCFCHPSTPW